MSGTITIRAGGTALLDPSDRRVVRFDWDSEALETGVQIATSEFSITVLKQIGGTALTKDQEAILAGNRTTRVRLDATTATAGDKYRINNKIVTNETPAQTVERSFLVVVQTQ